MTLKKIAELAETSVATVSKAFSGSREISDDTAERIFDAARSLGCFDKYYKGPRRRPVIGLLFPETESEYYSRQIGILENEITKLGADTIVGLTRFDRDREARLFSDMAYKLKVDGVIINGSGAKIVNPDEIPLVTFSSGNTQNLMKMADEVILDYQSGLEQAVATIKKYGYTRVGYVGETLTAYKKKLLCHALRKHGLPVCEELMYTSELRFGDAGEEGFDVLEKRGELPEVIVSAYDRIAIGVMTRARAKGYSIPKDFSVIGIDDITIGDYLDTPLSSLHIHLEDACRTIVELIFKKMNNKHYRERRKIIIPVTLNIKKSLAPKA